MNSSLIAPLPTVKIREGAYLGYSIACVSLWPIGKLQHVHGGRYEGAVDQPLKIFNVYGGEGQRSVTIQAYLKGSLGHRNSSGQLAAGWEHGLSQGEGDLLL